MKRTKPSKEQIVEDIALMLNSEVSDGAIWCLVRDTYAWAWSENSAEIGKRGKYRRCRYWSKNAVELWLSEGRLPNGEAIVHEHVVPRSILAERIVGLRRLGLPVTKEQVLDLFEKYCFGCVVLRTEDRKLPRTIPKGTEFDIPWLRYKRTPDIIVGEIDQGDPSSWKVVNIDL